MKHRNSDAERETSSVPDQQHEVDHTSLAGERGAVASLHRIEGNRAVQRLHERGALQASMDVSHPDDREEREAERVAEAVLQGDESTHDGRTPAVTRRASDGTGGDGSLDSDTEAEIRSVTTGGRPLPASTRSFFESRFGRDFSDVRVHTGSKADAAARSIDAEAFIHRRDIVFKKGKYNPDGSDGQRLLAHELTHVLQQRGSTATVQRQDDGTQEESSGETKGESAKNEGLTLAERRELFVTYKDNHRVHVISKIEDEFGRQAQIAKEGAKAGVDSLFKPYEQSQKWDGLVGDLSINALSLTPIPGWVATILDSIIKTNLYMRDITINELKGSINGDIENKLNEELMFENSERRSKNVQQILDNVRREYFDILSRGELDKSAAGSGKMQTKLINYADDQIQVTAFKKQQISSWVQRTYGPVVERALNRPDPFQSAVTSHHMRSMNAPPTSQPGFGPPSYKELTEKPEDARDLMKPTQGTRRLSDEELRELRRYLEQSE